jgi:hypothetical protein
VAGLESGLWPPHRAPGRYIADAQSSLVVRLTVDVPAIDLACTHMQIPGPCASNCGCVRKNADQPKTSQVSPLRQSLTPHKVNPLACGQIRCGPGVQ